MRNAVLITTTAILSILTLMIVMTINGRMNRSMEVTSNFPSIVEETLENMVLNPKYNIENTNEFVADLVETLSMTVDADSDVEVDILQCDKERGILSVRATLNFTHPNGKTGTVSTEKLAIFNQLLEDEVEQYRVIFYVGSDVYKEYVVTEGTIIAAPVSPVLSEGVFYRWVDGSAVPVDFSLPVLQNQTYYAIIE